MSEPEDHPIWSLRPDFPATPVSALPWAAAARPVSPPPIEHSVSAPPIPPQRMAPPPVAPPSSGRRTGLIVLAGVIVLAVAAGAVTAVALVSHKKSGTNAAFNRPAGNVSAADPARGGVGQGQPVDPGLAKAGASSVANSPSTAASTPNATLVDNFDGTAPDTHRWGLYESTKANGAKWLKTNVQVHNGELQLIGSGTDPTGKANTAAGLCWCGDGGNRLYGTWEVRARYDAGSGYGQVIGLWPRSDSQTDGSLSFADTSDPARQNMHGRVVTSAAPGTVSTSVNGDFTAWHTFKVDWRATSIKMYVDGKVFFDSTTSSTKVTIPKTPMHLIMQQPVGPGSGVPAANASTPTKVVLHIDWVKVSP